MNEIIIVGNGTSILDKENGKLIDSYKKVIRFNSYRLKDYEKHTGEKTNIWFNVTNEMKMENYESIYLHSCKCQNDPFIERLYKKFLNCSFYKKNKTLILKTDFSNCLELSEYCGDKNLISFSSGIVAIWIFLKKYESVAITGFDWWEREKNHFYDSVPRCQRHRPKVEKRIIDRLILENKIKVI